MKKLNNTLFMLKYAVKYAPSFCFWTVVEGIVWGCIHSFTSVVFVKALFDKIERNAPFQEVLGLVLLMALFFIFAYIFHEWYWQFIEPKAKQELHKKMQEKLYKKAIDLDISCYDNPKFYNDFVWAISEADTRTITICEHIGKIINRLISSTVIVSILFSVDIWILVAVSLSVAITVILKILRAKIQFKRDNEIKPFQRKASYIERVHYLKEHAKEIRMSDAEDILERDFDSSVKSIIKSTKRYGLKMLLMSFVRSSFTSLLFDSAILLFLVYKIMIEKSITLGDFAATIGAMWKLFWQINNLMDFFANFKEHELYAEKFRTFLNYEPTVCNSENCRELQVPIETIEFKNVSFAYAEGQEDIIKNLSLTINAGQKIALVGYNGAGKSTLIKLLLRFYDPTEGEILVNGENIKNFTLESYRNKFGTVFQDFQIYAATVAENVLADQYTNDKEENVLQALLNSEFNILPTLMDGISTELTKEFNKEGIELSGGEAQKLAIARIFAKNCETAILDEPSSALDPISEYQLNNTIMNSFDKTVIIISHRLSTTKMADVIYMLENGQIIENGSHSALIKANGKYAEMFIKQSEKYSL